MESFVAVSIVLLKFARKGDNRLYANTRTNPIWLNRHLQMPPINTKFHNIPLSHLIETLSIAHHSLFPLGIHARYEYGDAAAYTSQFNYSGFCPFQ